jgi:hypothetical protein
VGDIDRKVEEEPSLPHDFNVQVRGFPEEIANRVGWSILAVAKELSKTLPLENLEGITVGADYREALDAIDRGFPVEIAPPRPTEDSEFGMGVAMALPVNRDGVLKTHIVFDGSIVAMVDSEDEGEAARAAELLAHEIGHAVDHQFKYEQFGNIYIMQVSDLVLDPVDQYLWDLSHFIWDEYFANRISAAFGNGEKEEELFLRVYDQYQDKIWESRCDYRDRKKSLDEFLCVVKHNLRLMFLATAYLLGFNDGHEKGAELTPIASEKLGQDELLRAFHPILLELWDNRREWTSYNEFLKLNEPALAILHRLYLYPTETDADELYMDVPVKFGR